MHAGILQPDQFACYFLNHNLAGIPTYFVRETHIVIHIIRVFCGKILF